MTSVNANKKTNFKRSSASPSTNKRRTEENLKKVLAESNAESDPSLKVTDAPINFPPPKYNKLVTKKTDNRSNVKSISKGNRTNSKVPPNMDSTTQEDEIADPKLVKIQTDQTIKIENKRRKTDPKRVEHKILFKPKESRGEDAKNRTTISVDVTLANFKAQLDQITERIEKCEQNAHHVNNENIKAAMHVNQVAKETYSKLQGKNIRQPKFSGTLHVSNKLEVGRQLAEHAFKKGLDNEKDFPLKLASLSVALPNSGILSCPKLLQPITQVRWIGRFIPEKLGGFDTNMDCGDMVFNNLIDWSIPKAAAKFGGHLGIHYNEAQGITFPASIDIDKIYAIDNASTNLNVVNNILDQSKIDTPFASHQLNALRDQTRRMMQCNSIGGTLLALCSWYFECLFQGAVPRNHRSSKLSFYNSDRSVVKSFGVVSSQALANFGNMVVSGDAYPVYCSDPMNKVYYQFCAYLVPFANRLIFMDKPVSIFGALTFPCAYNTSIVVCSQSQISNESDDSFFSPKLFSATTVLNCIMQFAADYGCIDLLDKAMTLTILAASASRYSVVNVPVKEFLCGFALIPNVFKTDKLYSKFDLPGSKVAELLVGAEVITKRTLLEFRALVERELWIKKDQVGNWLENLKLVMNKNSYGKVFLDDEWNDMKSLIGSLIGASGLYQGCLTLTGADFCYLFNSIDCSGTNFLEVFRKFLPTKSIEYNMATPEGKWLFSIWNALVDGSRWPLPYIQKYEFKEALAHMDELWINYMVEKSTIKFSVISLNVHLLQDETTSIAINNLYEIEQKPYKLGEMTVLENQRRNIKRRKEMEDEIRSHMANPNLSKLIVQNPPLQDGTTQAPSSLLSVLGHGYQDLSAPINNAIQSGNKDDDFNKQIKNLQDKFSKMQIPKLESNKELLKKKRPPLKNKANNNTSPIMSSNLDGQQPTPELNIDTHNQELFPPLAARGGGPIVSKSLKKQKDNNIRKDQNMERRKQQKINKQQKQAKKSKDKHKKKIAPSSTASSEAQAEPLFDLEQSASPQPEPKDDQTISQENNNLTRSSLNNFEKESNVELSDFQKRAQELTKAILAEIEPQNQLNNNQIPEVNKEQNVDNKDQKDEKDEQKEAPQPDAPKSSTRPKGNSSSSSSSSKSVEDLMKINQKGSSKFEKKKKSSGDKSIKQQPDKPKQQPRPPNIVKFETYDLQNLQPIMIDLDMNSVSVNHSGQVVDFKDGKKTNYVISHSNTNQGTLIKDKCKVQLVTGQDVLNIVGLERLFLRADNNRSIMLTGAKKIFTCNQVKDLGGSTIYWLSLT